MFYPLCGFSFCVTFGCHSTVAPHSMFLGKAHIGAHYHSMGGPSHTFYHSIQLTLRPDLHICVYSMWAAMRRPSLLTMSTDNSITLSLSLALLLATVASLFHATVPGSHFFVMFAHFLPPSRCQLQKKVCALRTLNQWLWWWWCVMCDVWWGYCIIIYLAYQTIYIWKRNE